jgi:NADH-quinone oxidoreductase subunit M
VAALGVILSALYLLWAYQRVFHGVATGDNAEIADASHKERWILVPIVVAILVLGVYPKVALDRVTPAVHELIVHVAPSGASR